MKRVSIELYKEERNGSTVYGAYIGSDSGSGIAVEHENKEKVAELLVPYITDFMYQLDDEENEE